jgi:sugar phosphate permease
MSPEDPLAPSIRYRWTVLVMLTLVYTFNFIDRQILVILQEPIKADLGLSDAQLGLLSGFSFALVYVTAGIPIAWLADRSNRRNIVAASLAFLELHDRMSGLVRTMGSY